MTPIFTGVAAALLSFFDTEGGLRADECARHAAGLVERGVSAVVVAGTTGEAPRLSRGERRELCGAVRGAVGSGIPMIVGVGAEDTRTVVEYGADALERGADALLVHPAREQDPCSVFEAVATLAGDVPVLAYHFPQRYPPGIPMARLPELPVRGVKDSEGDAGRLLEEARAYNGEIYVGSAPLLHTAGLLGCTGAILAIANLEPELAAEAFAGSAEAFRRLMDVQMTLHGQGVGRIKQLLVT